MQALPELDNAEEWAWLDRMCAANGYLSPVIIGPGRYAVLSPFAFTMAIITGQLGDDYGYADRWCFDSWLTAAASLSEWGQRDFAGEPIGWHRHPDSGRRRPDGDPAQEYINP